jgi:hypothetical protein
METYETINETILYIRECEFDQVNIKTLDYMMGSQLYNSIKDMVKGRSHLFACLENGLNRFTFQEILDIKHNLIADYNAEKKDRVSNKMRQFGTPYDLYT